MVRKNLVAALSEGAPVSVNVESTFSKRSLGTSLVDDLLHPLGPVSDTFSVSSSLPVEELRKRMDTWVGLPLLKHSSKTWRYGFGLPNMWSDNWAELKLVKSSDEEPKSLSGVITLSGTEPRNEQVMAFQGARTLLSRLQRTLSLSDPNLTITRPTKIPEI